ncbi:MAG: hypothetical protein HY238_20285 [Acidobacteria bacterium]|nr:hypothetical protein [Acidobacteriota bacterium]
MTRAILAVYASISAVYLLYLPHALPVLDDWMYLQLFHQARAGGIGAQLAFVHRLIDNTWLVQFRIFWASLMPVFALSYAADFAGWPYFLLAWTAHLLTAFLLARIVAALSGDPETGFAAGAVYAVFPAANNALFWSVSNCIYYLQSLCLLWWFHLTWKKLAAGDFRYRWRNFALLLPVVFSGEQILPALALLLPVAFGLLGRRDDRPAFFRFWLSHLAAMGAVVGVYAFAINGMSILQGFRNRYEGAHGWSLRPFSHTLFGSLGLGQDFFQWPARWWTHGPLLALALLCGVSLWLAHHLWLAKGSPARLGELLLWSVAGVILTYLPAARLSSFEARYLYVPCMFLVAAGVAMIGLLARPFRLAVVFLTVSYFLAQTYFGMVQCWIPQSKEARGILDAVAAADPFEPREVLVFSGDHLSNGVAPSFITGASWALQSMLEHYTRADHVQGARDLVINEKGEMALHRRDSFRPFHRQELDRLRAFVRQPDNRFVPKSVLALPVAEDRFELIPLRSNAGRALPSGTLSREELKLLPLYPDIYFARRIHSHARPQDI